MNIAVIPARGGSKRIPRKNIKEFCGKPMIAWTIELAKNSGLFDRVIVSTDDKEIATIAASSGAEVPFVRPAELADDRTPTVPVIAHAVKLCFEIGRTVDYACCIYPCVPFLQIGDLRGALQLITETGSNFAYPVTEYAHPVQRAMRQLPGGAMQLIQGEYELTRTQDLEKCYHDTGQFYWGKAAAWLAHKRMHTDGVGMAIPNWRVVDIDSIDDWRRAENMLNSMNIATRI